MKILKNNPLNRKLYPEGCEFFSILIIDCPAMNELIEEGFLCEKDIDFITKSYKNPEIGKPIELYNTIRHKMLTRTKIKIPDRDRIGDRIYADIITGVRDEKTN